jgi:FOG: Ankyrin repeat
MKKFCFLFLMMFSSAGLLAQGNAADSALLNALHTNQIDVFSELLNSDSINSFLGNPSEPILFHAILEDNLAAVKVAVKKGASTNLLYNDLNALMFASIHGKIEIGRYLIEIGSNVNALNSRRNTALIYAARYGRLNVVKLLLDHGADPEVKNIVNSSALDYAEKYSESRVSELIKLAIGNKYIPYLSSFYDGPHLYFNSPKALKIQYLSFDSTSKSFSIIQNTIPYKKKPTSFTSFFEANSTYTIYPLERKSQKFDLKEYSRVLAVGDVHGEFDSLVVLLRNNHVIDNNNQWSYGNGFLVFIGDLFDRGNKVTETLWLVYRLQHEARNFGGDVFVLLGNHDLMELTGDTRYLNSKYLTLCSKNGIEYKDLFTKEYVLGNWIRNQKSIIRIGNLLFSHAGVSPSLLRHNFSLLTINRLVNQFLNIEDLDGFERERFLFLTGEMGLFWYRGYFMESLYGPQVIQNDVDAVNKYFGIKQQIIGHTEVVSISPTYNNSVIPINVPFNSPVSRLQALFIENDRFYRVYGNGEKVFLLSNKE